MLAKEGVMAKSVEGNGDSAWVLMDYGDFIVHIFDRESRTFYDLERIWKDAESVKIEEL